MTAQRHSDLTRPLKARRRTRFATNKNRPPTLKHLPTHSINLPSDGLI